MRIYRLLTGPGRPRLPQAIIGLIITPEDMDAKRVTAAWSYALRYSAKGLDVPDTDAAVKLMLDRHPSWRFESRKFPDVWYQPSTAENDKPD